MNRAALAVSALLLTMSGGAGVWAQQHDHGDDAAGHTMDGHDMEAGPPAVATPPGAPVLYTADDLHFMHHMTVHHQQALEMSALAPGRGGRPEFERFASYIADAQRAEIRAMQGMVDMAAARGLPPPAHLPHTDPPMAGMLSSAEMEALAAAEGPDFERLWLQGMIFHHEGGLAMARAQELQQARNRRQPYGLAVMLDEILLVQRTEIAQMRGWLEDWGLSGDGGDARPPAIDVISPAPDAVLPGGTEAILYGAAVDDTGVAAVRVAVQDLATQQWLQEDGGWGEQAWREAALIGSGPASAAWTIAFTPAPGGRYAVTAEAEDSAGKRAPNGAPQAFEAR